MLPPQGYGAAHLRARRRVHIFRTASPGEAVTEKACRGTHDI